MPFEFYECRLAGYVTTERLCKDGSIRETGRGVWDLGEWRLIRLRELWVGRAQRWKLGPRRLR
jgi:hypothetical protein